jgi:hypothetical protein
MMVYMLKSWASLDEACPRFSTLVALGPSLFDTLCFLNLDETSILSSTALLRGGFLESQGPGVLTVPSFAPRWQHASKREANVGSDVHKG